MHLAIPNHRTRRVEAIRQNVRRHQQAAERQKLAEKAAPAYLQHHGRISTCTPETFLRKRKPVPATASVLRGDLGYAFHDPSHDTESNTQSVPTETCVLPQEHIVTEPRTPIKVPERSDSFDEDYDLTPRYMRRYLTREARARPQPDPRPTASIEKKTALDQGSSTSMFNIANPYSAFMAPIEPPAYLAGPSSPLEKRRRGLFQQDKAAPQLPRQPVVSTAVVSSPANMQSSSMTEWKRAENGRDEALTSSSKVLEQGAMNMSAFLDTMLCIFALGLVVVAGAGTMSTFIALMTAPASW
ncbi:hypothetical protein CB0940_04131 [Cercospora beticola]|uniref:Uncharacterized protein n=1 Tax=Cercospora beticola TaxID=122368 RepID=A0A2G5HK81_CERBT|nr:hypothetical protein CB0940_04131 [Cercospora beticola]PIA92966.1 hypothetical protein CB0940_04131 [Cercospora beticola]WPB01345.1 hypothetical protein RHO25_005969 [Cercospora beticola]